MTLEETCHLIKFHARIKSNIRLDYTYRAEIVNYFLYIYS
jgi:hypothetical protein